MIGEQISHYRIESELGSGTYGVVYRGVHVGDEELKVAIKVVHPSLLDDPKFVDSLKSECRRLDKLDHSAIVRFRDLILGEAQVAMVLELLEGKDLHDHIQAGPVAIEQALDIMDKALSGLAYAHGKEVIHRDIKPSNIFLCDDGRVKILDFGIARAAQNTQATQTGTMKGTLDYMAPERFQATGGGAVSDVYALGLVAWELVAGKPACPAGGLPEKLGWHLGVGAPDLRSVRKDCPEWLAEVIGQMTAMDSDARPADGAAALQAFEQGRASQAASPAAAPAEEVRAVPSTVAVGRDEVEAALAEVRKQSAASAVKTEVQAPPPMVESPTPVPPPVLTPEPAPAEPSAQQTAPPLPPPAASGSSKLPIILGLVAALGLLVVLAGIGAAVFLNADDGVASTRATQVSRTPKKATKAAKKVVRAATKAAKRAEGPASAFVLTGGRAANPSFQCSRARSWASVHICKDTQLAGLDRTMAKKYNLVRNRLSGYAKENWKGEQLDWKNGSRDVCENRSSERDQKACMVSSYKRRISEIERHPSY